MILTNLKLATRFFVKQRLYSAINLLGLSIGLACCLLIALYVVDELSYDTQHPDSERIYRYSRSFVDLEEPLYMAANAPQVGPLLKQTFTEIEDYTRLLLTRQVLSVDDESVYEAALQMADPSAFNFFTFDWLQGSAATALTEPLSIVLTQSLARRYFDDEPAVGKVLLMGTDKQLPLKVTGVIADLPHNTHLVGDALVSMATIRLLEGAGFQESWGNNNFRTYLKVKPGVDFARLQPSLTAHVLSNMPEQNRQGWEFSSLNIRDIHLHSPLEGPGMKSSGNFDNLVTLAVIGAALLLIAAINFVNLATACAMQRYKEICLRKVFGSSRWQLFTQFISETLVMVLLALIVALALAELALPLVSSLSAKPLQLQTLMSSASWLLLMGGSVLLLALSAGCYPALYLSALRPIVAMQKRMSGKQTVSLRSALVVCQFAVAIALVVATLIVYQQVQYGKQVELGFNQKQLLMLKGPNAGVGESWSAMKRELLSHPGVSVATLASARPFDPYVSVWDVRYEGSNETKVLTQLRTDADYFATYEVQLLAGRAYSDSNTADALVAPTEVSPAGTAAFLLNRAAIELLGWQADEAIGKALEVDTDSNSRQSIQGRVVGVVDNMRTGSLRDTIKPTFYMLSTRRSNNIAVRLTGNNIADTMEFIESTWAKFHPGQPINASFLDTTFQALYEKEERFSQLLAVFSVLTILIASLGLFGLTAIAVEKRTKEIGVRKVMGSSVWQIVVLLTNDFSRLVLLSNLLAWPVAYYAMNRWLENFAYRIELTPLIFIGSGLIALCIAWVTVGGTAAKAASQKPVLALRYE
jgi:putative ABC transport system permease protein